MFLDAVDPGQSSTEPFSFDKLPLETGDLLTLELADGSALAGDDALVLVRRPDGSVGTVSPSLSVDADDPSAGDSVEFDASASESSNGDILRYWWDFGDGQTAEGERVVHEFAEAGTYEVSLEVVDEVGQSERTTEWIEVAEGSADGLPGFGVLDGAATLAGAGYLLRRRTAGEDET